MPPSVPPAAPGEDLQTSREDIKTIGVAARLVGMKVDTIRMWERRYAVVRPGRSASGDRVYSDAMIQRLAILKALVDRGFAIGTLAGLSQEQLAAQLQSLELARARHAPAQGGARIILAGVGLRASVAQGSFDWARVVATFASVQELEAQPDVPDADLVVVELASLQDPTVLALDALSRQAPGRAQVVLYGFGRRSALRSLALRGVLTRQLPVDTAALRQACALALGAAGEASAMTRRASRFSERDLVWLGTHAESIACECPRHLVTLLRGLGAFETYSRECGLNQAEDQELHRFLEASAGAARTLLEEALSRVIEADGIALPTKAD